MADYENNENMNENENAENESGNGLADAIGNIAAKVVTATLTFGAIYGVKKLVDKVSDRKPATKGDGTGTTSTDKISWRERRERRKDKKAAERLRKRGHDVKESEQEETKPEQDEE